MKKYYYFLGFVALLSYQCSSDPVELINNVDINNPEVELQVSTTRTMERIADTLYIIENERRYVVNPNVVTVKYKTDAKKSQKIDVIRASMLGYIDIRVPNDIDVEKYASLLKESGEFETVEYGGIGSFYYSPNDARIGEQWYLDKIEARSAWDVTAGSSSVKVFVLDTGLDISHNDLGNGTDGYSNIDTSLAWNYVNNSSNVLTSNSHGTIVAGIIAAKTNNNTRGIAGIAGGKGSSSNRGITIIPYCIGIGYPVHDVIDNAIIDAVNAGARVIQISFGVPSDSAITNAINYATQNGVIVVACSGNDENYPIDGNPVEFPASLSNVIAVGASSRNDWRMDFSNYGSNLNVMAPGDDILSTTLNGGYTVVDGTSFAAPIVSAIAALIWSKYPNFTRQQVIDLIESTAAIKGTIVYPNRQDEYGYGTVNANRALLGHLAISGPDNARDNTNDSFTATTPPSGVTFNGWTISPSSYTTTGTSSTTLEIKFLTEGTYYVTAKYRLPDNTPRDVVKTVNTKRIWSISHYPSYPTPGAYMSFTAVGFLGSQFQWTVEPPGGGSPFIDPSSNSQHFTWMVPYNFDMDSDRVVIGCQTRDSNTSPWSVTTYVFLYPQNRAPAPNNDEPGETEESDEESDEASEQESEETILAELVQ